MNFEGTPIRSGGSGGSQAPFPVSSNGSTVITGNFPKYLDTTGRLIGDSGKNASSFLAITGGSLTGDVDMQDHALLDAQIVLQTQNIVPANSSTVYPVTLTVDIVIVNTNNFAALLSLANPSLPKRLTIRLLYQRGLSVTITTAQNEVIVIDATTPIVNLAYDGTSWFVLSMSYSLVNQMPTLTSVTKIIPTGIVGTISMGSSLFNQLSISNDATTLIFGGPSDNVGIGAAYVWFYSGGIWAQQQRLTGSGTPLSFGSASCISGDGNTAFIGAFGTSAGIGSVYEFTRTGSTWTQANLLTPTGNIGNCNFGAWLQCSVDGKILFVGGPNDNTGTGALFIFTKSGSTWTQQQKYTSATVSTGAGTATEFSCKPDGSLVILSSPYDDVTNTYGAINVIQTTNFTTWNQIGPKFSPTPPIINSYFGASLVADASCSTLLCTNAQNTNSGVLDICNVSSGFPSVIASVSGSDQVPPTTASFSQCTISSDGNVLCWGAYSDNTNIGAAWIFGRHGQNWLQYGAKIVPTSPIGSTIYFGLLSCVSNDGGTICIAGPEDNSGIGAVWIYQ